MNVFSIKNAVKVFENYESFKSVKKVALDNVTFSVDEGDNIAIIGSNGCGKSTLLNILTGLYKLSSGQALFYGKPINGTSHMADISITLPNGIGLIPEMTIKKFFELKSYLYNNNKDLHYGYIKKFRLEKLLKKRISRCSSGEQQRVSLLSNIMADKKILIFDEPTNNLDMYFKFLFYETLEELKLKKKTILLVSHDISEIYKMDKILLLSNGHLEEIIERKSLTDKNELEEKLRNFYFCKSHTYQP